MLIKTKPNQTILLLAHHNGWKEKKKKKGGRMSNLGKHVEKQESYWW